MNLFNFFSIRAPLAILIFLSATAFARAGTVTVSVAPSSIDEGDDAIFTFTNTPVDFSRSTKVIYYTAGTALYGDNYTLSGTPGVIIIPAGQASADVILHARADGHFDRTEDAALIVGEKNRYRVGTPKRASVTIYDVQ